MQIKDLATATGVDVETIRYYEKKGLLATPARRSNGYRDYSEAHLTQLTFIRHCRGLDMSLEEIRLLVHFMTDPNEHCSQVNELIDQHIGHVATRIAELRSLQKQLLDLRGKCDSARTVSQCGILSELTQERCQPGKPHEIQKHHMRGSHRTNTGH